MVVAVPEVLPSDGKTDDDIVHTVRCDDYNTALCGVDLTHDCGWLPPGRYPNDCVECELLAQMPCGCSDHVQEWG